MSIPLSEHLPLIATAPGGIQKLRGLILELAVRGKLEPQDPNDEPASELLKRISQVRSRLDGAKSRKKIEPPLHASASPLFDLPSSWTWVPFGEIALHNSGKTLDKGRNAGQARDYITTSNLYWGRFELSELKRMLISDDELERCTARKDDLLICEGGEAGRAAVWSFDREVCFQNHVHRARFMGNIDPYFGFRFFEWLNASGEIEHYRKGVGISNMSGKALASIPFTLPPLAEQQRIVAKVDELMALCDRLESEQNDSAAAHGQLVETLLATLTQSTDAAEFEANWKCIAEHFDTLFTTEASIKTLQKSILHLAVTGKLTQQNPEEEPAQELLAKIVAHRLRMENEGLCKKQKPVPTIEAKDQVFLLPSSWTWSSLAALLERLSNGYSGAQSKAASPHPLTRIETISNSEINFNKTGFCTNISELDIEKYRLRSGDILLSHINSDLHVGKTALFEDDRLLIHGINLLLLRPLQHCSPAFINLVINWHRLNGYFLRIAQHAIGQSSINQTKLSRVPIPLPPLAEQHRIVAKVNELMAVCDQLKVSLKATASAKQVLSATLIQKALEAA